MYDRETILDAMARTIFVCAYADHCDECDDDECEICGECGSAGGGQDWMDVAPEGHTDEAMEIAVKMVERFENANNIQLETAYARAAARQNNAVPARSWYKPPTRFEFGYCLAMEAMGHGVGWSDSHPDHGFEVLQVEGLYL